MHSKNYLLNEAKTAKFSYNSVNDTNTNCFSHQQQKKKEEAQPKEEGDVRAEPKRLKTESAGQRDIGPEFQSSKNRRITCHLETTSHSQYTTLASL